MDPVFVRISFDLATGIGVQAAAEALGVTGRTLQRAWKRHGLGPLRLGRTLRRDVAPYLIGGAVWDLGWIEDEARLGYLAWDRQTLGRPPKPQGWTKRFMAERELVDQAFELAREQSILAVASAFQVSAPTLRRAFAHHGLGHPHAGLEASELRRRWSTEAEGNPDHHQRRQRRLHRACVAAERRAGGSA